MATKPVSEMTAGEINKALDKLDRASSILGDRFIEAGRGHEKPTETWKLDDPLAREFKKLSSERSALHNEMERRYGPGVPSRLPRGFGPIRNPKETPMARHPSHFATGTPEALSSAGFSRSTWPIVHRMGHARAKAAEAERDELLAEGVTTEPWISGHSVALVVIGGKPKTNPPSDLAAQLITAFPKEPRAAMTALARRLEEAQGRRREAMEALREANRVLEGFGLERVRHVEYVNTGDTYSPTVLLDTKTNRFSVGTWGDVEEQGQREDSLRLRDEAGAYADEVLEAMARTLWVSAYADWADSEEAPEDIERPGGGEDWADYAPETPIAAQQAAWELAEGYALLNTVHAHGAPGRLLADAAQHDDAKAVLADYFEEHGHPDEAALVRSALNKESGSTGLAEHGVAELMVSAIEADHENKGRDLEPSDIAEDFGHYLVMMALGEGVSWFDDHAEFELKHPYIEALTDDGETLVTSGLPGSPHHDYARGSSRRRR